MLVRRWLSPLYETQPATCDTQPSRAVRCVLSLISQNWCLGGQATKFLILVHETCHFFEKRKASRLVPSRRFKAANCLSRTAYLAFILAR
jgi:hypothetical protein